MLPMITVMVFWLKAYLFEVYGKLCKIQWVVLYCQCFGHFIYFRVVSCYFLLPKIVSLFCCGYYGIWFLSRITRIRTTSVAGIIDLFILQFIPCIQAYPL